MFKEKRCSFCNALLKAESIENFCEDRCKQTIKSANHHEAVLNLIDYLNSYTGLTSAFNLKIGSMLGAKSLNAKIVVAKKGDMCTTAFWIDSGYGRAYHKVEDKEGIIKEITVEFYKPKKILVVGESYFNDLPCTYDVELARDSVIVPFPKDYFEALKLSAPEAEMLANKILSLEKIENLEKSQMQKMKPRPRYHEFLRIFGKEIEQFFAVKHIASFLGIAPSYLSRLRAEIKNK